MTEPSQTLVVPPSASSSRPKKSASRPPKKKARVSAPVEPSKPSSKPQPPTIESQIPSGMTPEASPELRDSFHLLQSYHLEHLMTPRDFFYPRVALDFYQSMTTHRVRDPTVIHFTIDKRHGILGARHIAEALHIPYEPARPEDFRVWAHPSQSDMVHYTVQRDIHMPISFEKGAPTQHVLSRCTSAPQHLSTSAYDAEEMSFTRGLVLDIRGIFLWPSSSHHGHSSLL
ncbi:hypothetical protein CK203_021849 [Vitis vinifera]|uniref:Uncharacterized protein n=1 Tax=Vitis vinifera TaxID=29760 RepID=A0A438JFW9_VITVI|nr:hypothetical protein CK203_021849 [Vitis vinifera]